MRTTITLPDPLLRSAKRNAASRGVTLSVFLEDAVRAQLARENARPAHPFRLYTVRGTLVQPGLDLDRTSALIALDDETSFASR
jgi:hypothetical protein